MLTKELFYLHSLITFTMRTFLVNFIYTSAGQSNADFILITQATFPTSHEIYKHIRSTSVEKGLQLQGALLWTGITELTETDEHQFNTEVE